MRRIEVERHLVAVLRRHPVAELLVERFADLVERLYPLPRVLRQLGDAGHVVDRLRRVVTWNPSSRVPERRVVLTPIPPE